MKLCMQKLFSLKIVSILDYYSIFLAELQCAHIIATQ